MQLKILCLNIWHGGKLREPLLEFLKAEDADILMFQEAYDPKELRLDYPHQRFDPNFLQHINGEKHDIGNAVFSKYPIISFDVQFYFEPYGDGYEDRRETYPFFPRNLQHVVIDAKGIQLNVFNTHGIWGEDGEDNERRLKVSDMIIEAIQDKEHVILGGDFNVNEATRSMQNVEKYLTSIFKGERTTSFNMKRKTLPGYATSVVDFIFVSPGIKLISHASPTVDVSDHLPMVATVEIS